jgi:hypothetical protein
VLVPASPAGGVQGGPNALCITDRRQPEVATREPMVNDKRLVSLLCALPSGAIATPGPLSPEAPWPSRQVAAKHLQFVCPHRWCGRTAQRFRAGHDRNVRFGLPFTQRALCAERGFIPRPSPTHQRVPQWTLKQNPDNFGLCLATPNACHSAAYLHVRPYFAIPTRQVSVRIPPRAHCDV